MRLVLFFYLDRPGIKKHKHSRCLAEPWLLGTAYAVTDEIHQYFVPERACAFTDMLIDSAGVAAGAMIMILILKARRK